MSYEYSFADNAEYGAEDLNTLVSSLVSSGVEDAFADGVAYNAGKVNDIIKTVYSDGVVPENAGTLKVTKVNNGTVAIAPGMAFFANGSTIRIIEAHQLAYEQGVKNYVYLKQDLAEQNRNYPACTTDAPTGDYVLLAEITTGGSITDKRTYARGKVPGYQSNANCSMVIDAQFSVYPETNGTTGTKSMNFDMGANNYSRVFVLVGAGNGYSNGQMGVYNFSDGSYFSVYAAGSFKGVSADKVVIGGGYNSRDPLGYLTFSVNGSKLTVTFEWDVSANADTTLYPFTMILC